MHDFFHALPEHLAATNYQNPTDVLNTAMARAFNTPGTHSYEIFASKPESARAVGTLMNMMGGKPQERLQHVYPIQEHLIDGFDPSASDVLFVDVGAGHGHVVAELKETFPNLRGRLVSEDLEHMVTSSPKAAGVEYLVHDFFTEQPLKSKSVPRVVGGPTRRSYRTANG